MGYNTEYGIIADELTEILQKRLAGVGKSDVDEIVREVLKDTDTVNRLKDIILSLLIGGATSERVRNYIVSESFALSVTYGGIKPKLSGTIHKLGKDAQRILSDTVKQSLTDGASWTKAMQNLRNQDLTIGDLPEYIKKAISGSKSDQQRARAMVRKLSSRTSPTTAVKNAYGRILDAVESDNKKALDKAIDSAINNKIKYNTARIARTEYAYAAAGASQKMIDEDNDIIGWVSSVSDNRPAGFHDICDMYNGQFFPKSVSILQPYHIQCMCSAEMVYKGKKMRKEWSEDISQKWLDANPDLAKTMVRGKPEKITPDKVIGYKNPKTAKKIKY
jgi:hypothetical protein